MHKFANELSELIKGDFACLNTFAVQTTLSTIWPSRSRVENENKAATNRYWVGVVNLELRGLILLEMCTDWKQIKKHLQQVQILTSYIRNLEYWAHSKKKKIQDYYRGKRYITFVIVIMIVIACVKVIVITIVIVVVSYELTNSLFARLTVQGLKVWDHTIVLMLCLWAKVFRWCQFSNRDVN